MWIEGGGRRRNCEVEIAAERRCGEGGIDGTRDGGEM